MHVLGVLLIKHPELAKSPQEALSLLETGAGLGSWKSSIVLGVLSRDGNGVPVDPATAYYHFQIAMLQGGEAAKKLLGLDMKSLSEKLTPDQMQKISSNADIWFQQRQSALAVVYKDGKDGKRFPVWGRAVDDEGLHGGKLLPPPGV